MTFSLDRDWKLVLFYQSIQAGFRYITNFNEGALRSSFYSFVTNPTLKVNRLFAVPPDKLVGGNHTKPVTVKKTENFWLDQFLQGFADPANSSAI